MFNNYSTNENIPSSYIKIASTVYKLLSILSYQCFFFADIKCRYWVVNISPNDKHYYVFYIPLLVGVKKSNTRGTILWNI